MAARNTKDEVREGFHGEVQQHLRMLKLEFDKVESAVIHAYRVECDNEEIKGLLDLKDAKMRLLRIRYNQEADLIVKEFKHKVEDILGKDITRYFNRATKTKSDGKKNGDGKKKTEEKYGNQVSKNADNMGLTRRTSRTSAGKRSRRYEDYKLRQNIDAEQAANVARTKRFLQNLKREPKEMSDYEPTNKNANVEEPNVPKRRLGKIIIKTGHKRIVVVKDAAGSNVGQTDQRRSSVKKENSAEQNKTIKEADEVMQDNEAQKTPKQTVKRRRKEKRGPNDAGKPKEQEKNIRKDNITIGSGDKSLVAAKVTSGEKDDGKASACGKDGDNTSLRETRKAKRRGEEEKDVQEAPKRKRKREDASNNESAGTEQPEEREKPSKKSKVTFKENVGLSSNQVQRGESNASAMGQNETQRDKGVNAESRARQNDEIQEVPVSNLRRSKRLRKPTAKAKGRK